jgi:hypothetical protein
MRGDAGWPDHDAARSIGHVPILAKDLTSLGIAAKKHLGAGIVNLLKKYRASGLKAEMVPVRGCPQSWNVKFEGIVA